MANDLGGRIWLISAEGDSLVQVTQTGANWYPSFSPDGRRIAFSTPDSDAGGPRGLRILDMETRAERQVYPYGLEPSWSPDGTQLVFQGWVYQNGGWAGGDDGCLAVVDTAGANPRIIHDPTEGGLESPSFSPSGAQVLFMKPYSWSAGIGQVWVVNRDGRCARKLTKMGGRWPAWSPDGTRIVYTRYSHGQPSQEGSGELYIMDADGSHERRLTFFDFNKQ